MHKCERAYIHNYIWTRAAVARVQGIIYNVLLERHLSLLVFSINTNIITKVIYIE